MHHFLQRLLWTWLTLLLCFWGSWLTLAQVNFAYPIWHDYGGIAEHIDRYAPLNLYRTGFEDTTPEARFELFAGIVEAIHHNGNGLAQLNYETPQHRVALLRQAEILHLEDVAHLISIVQSMALYGLIIWVIWTVILVYYRRYPTLKEMASALAVGAIGLVTPLLIWGPQAVFYKLHTWVFPAQHQWFFYYQESLMSTMMKAPDLFGYIFISLVVVGICLFTVVHLTIQRFSHRFIIKKPLRQ